MQHFPVRVSQVILIKMDSCWLVEHEDGVSNKQRLASSISLDVIFPVFNYTLFIKNQTTLQIGFILKN